MKKLLLLITSILLVSCSSEETLSTVSLDVENLTIEVGESYTFKTSYSPSDMSEPIYEWRCADNSIATVKDGTVTGRSEGYTSIDVYVDGVYYDSCSITVVAATVKRITLNKSNLNMKIGDVATIEYNIEPEYAKNYVVRYSSTDNSIAKAFWVNNILNIRAVGEGEADIILSAGNNITAKCNVKVESIPLEGINFPSNLISLEETDEFKIDLNYIPDNASNKNVTFSIDDETIADITNGILIAKRVGKTKITAISEDGGHQAECEIEVTLKGIHISASQYAYLPGETGILWSKSEATLEAYLGAIWESSNPEIVEVWGESPETNSAGIVTKQIGDAYITAYSHDRSKSGICPIKVRDMDYFVELNCQYRNANGQPSNLSFNVNASLVNNSSQSIIITYILAVSGDKSTIYFATPLNETLPAGQTYAFERIYASGWNRPSIICIYEWSGNSYQESNSLFN